MATLTLDQVPDELHRRLKERAAAHRRSVNHEAIMCLEQALQPRRFDPQGWLEEVRALRRQAPTAQLTDSLLRTGRSQGRP